MKKKKLKPRYKFLIASLIIITVGFFTYAVISGSNYQIGIPYIDEDFGPDVDVSDSVEAKCNDESIVKITSVYTQKDRTVLHCICIDTQSVSQGKCSIDISFNDSDVKDTVIMRHDLVVLPFGVIYDLTTDNFSAMKIGIHVEVLVLIIFTIVLILSFIEKFKNGNFSYSMAVLGGVILFLAITVITTFIDPWYWQINSSLFTVRMLLTHIVNSGYGFIAITTLPVLILAVALCISNVILIKKEGFGLHNALGFFIGFAILAGIVVIELSGNFANVHSDMEFAVKYIFNHCAIFLLCYFECMLISTAFCAVAATKYKVKFDIDYIIILGCALMGDGTPTPHLMGRIQRAYDFEAEQYKSTGKHAKFVPSGGQGSDEVISEAESMKRKLEELGIDGGKIIKEDKSVNTSQNMSFSKKAIENDTENIEDVNIAFSTTNYHVFRGYTLAKKAGMNAKGLSAKTKFYFFPNAFIREFIGLVWEQKKRHLLFALLIIASIALLYLLIIY